MENYTPAKIEQKWQQSWEKEGLYLAEDFSDKKKYYLLIEFPYPSGKGLHVGHCRAYSAMDAVSRKKRAEGYNVLFPIGWDAFGLPTENYSLRTGIHPEVATKRNIANFKRQLKSLGLSFDWTREINTADPEYYKWTQWIFLKFFEKGLAYQTEIPINFCPKCKIGLADEEVVDGKHERCGVKVVKKTMRQWVLKITEYAERLIKDLDKVDYLDKIKAQQINWIGKSEGTTVKFQLTTCKKQPTTDIKVFTTRPDTIFGVTAIVLAPEHSIIKKLEFGIQNLKEVKNYIKKSEEKTEFERTQLEKKRTGVPLDGVFAVNPVNQEKIPVWVADYVIGTYGGGAVMLVPAHDKRDYDFAKRYNLSIRQVVAPKVAADKDTDLRRLKSEPFVDYGVLINSGEFSGLSSKEAIEKITQWLEKRGIGKKSIQYKIRDWVFSRQHYWGEPIPLIFCQNCKKLVENSKFQIPNSKKIQNSKFKIQNFYFNLGELLNPGWIAIPEKDLPVELPYVERYQPTGTGESPLAAISGWANTRCPKCGSPAKRETDTMPNWAGSNWYCLAYAFWHKIKDKKPKTKTKLAELGGGKNQNVFEEHKKEIGYWLPVDWYNGGMEHTTLHLLYSRFVYKFLYDIGIVPTPEPYHKRTSHGIVLGEDGRKMSKSFGNVINPDDIIKQYGADTLRVYEMFMGPFDQAIAWSTQGVKGVYRFLRAVWRLQYKVKGQKPKAKSTIQNSNLDNLIHKTIKKVSEDLERCRFNTAVSSLMILANALEKEKEISQTHYSLFLILLSPFAPHITEELWQKIGNKTSIHKQKWPKWNPEMVKEEMITLIVQVNGKVRDKIEVEANISEEKAKGIVLSHGKIQKWIEGKEIEKVIFVPQKLINFVIKEK